MIPTDKKLNLATSTELAVASMRAAFASIVWRAGGATMLDDASKLLDSGKYERPQVLSAER